MTVVTTRPNSTISNAGWTVSGGVANAHTALSDDSSATAGVVSSGTASASVELGIALPSLPSGAKFVSASCRIKARNTGGGSFSPLLDTQLSVNGKVFAGQQQITWTTTTQYSAAGGVVDDSITALEATMTRRASTADWHTLLVTELEVVSVYATKPTVTVTAPTGTITANKPTVKWTPSLDSDGGAQTHYEIKVFTAATVAGGGFSAGSSAAEYGSGIVSSAAKSKQIPQPLIDGGYSSYVRVAQTVNGVQHWSNWSGQAFTIDGPNPGNPTVTLTPEPTSGRVKIALASTPGQTGSSTNAYEVQRSIDGGTSWRQIRTVQGAGRTTGSTIYDYEAPLGSAVQYRAAAIDTTTESYSGWTTASTTLNTTSWWLKHPTIPSLRVELVFGRIRSVGGYQRDARQATFHPLGAKHAVVISDTPGPRTGQLVTRLDTVAEQDALAALFASASVVLVQAPAGDHGWVDRWCSFASHDVEKVIDHSWSTLTWDTLPWTEVARPTGNLTSFT